MKFALQRYTYYSDVEPSGKLFLRSMQLGKDKRRIITTKEKNENRRLSRLRTALKRDERKT